MVEIVVCTAKKHEEVKFSSGLAMIVCQASRKEQPDIKSKQTNGVDVKIESKTTVSVMSVP